MLSYPIFSFPILADRISSYLLCFLILSYPILSYLLCYPFLSCLIIWSFVLSSPFFSDPILADPILSYFPCFLTLSDLILPSVLSYPILSFFLSYFFLVLSYPICSYSIISLLLCCSTFSHLILSYLILSYVLSYLIWSYPNGSELNLILSHICTHNLMQVSKMQLISKSVSTSGYIYIYRQIYTHIWYAYLHTSMPDIRGCWKPWALDQGLGYFFAHLQHAIFYLEWYLVLASQCHKPIIWGRFIPPTVILGNLFSRS